MAHTRHLRTWLFWLTMFRSLASAEEFTLEPERSARSNGKTVHWEARL